MTLTKYVRAGSFAAAFALGAGVALSALTAAVSSATAQELEWAKQAGGTGFEHGVGIATDPRGNSYVTGGFRGTVTFGAGEDNETKLSAMSIDSFIAQYDRNGLLVWAKQAGGAGDGAFFNLRGGIATDPHGNSYVTGEFGGTATFGAGEDNETKLTAVGDVDTLVAQYDRNGLLVWAKQAGGADAAVLGEGIATDPRGTIYVTDEFGGTATFGAGKDNETKLTAVGGLDTFVAKYDRNGLLIWAKQAGGADAIIFGLGIATDPRGNSYLTGYFQGTPTFGAGEDNETQLAAPCCQVGFFIAKYDRNGLLVWAKQAGGADAFIYGHGIATDPRGNSYVTGNFQGAPTFGAGEDNEIQLIPASLDTIFLAKYDRNGRVVWAKQAGGTGFEHGVGIATDPHGNSYVTGDFRGTPTFGSGEDNETQLSAAGGDDIFVAKYATDGTLLWATSSGGGGGNDFGYGIASDGHGNSYVTGAFNGTATFGAGEHSETQLSAAGSRDIFVAKYGASNNQNQ